jgi:hypothetical protein
MSLVHPLELSEIFHSETEIDYDPLPGLDNSLAAYSILHHIPEAG